MKLLELIFTTFQIRSNHNLGFPLSRNTFKGLSLRKQITVFQFFCQLFAINFEIPRHIGTSAKIIKELMKGVLESGSQNFENY